MRNVAKVDERRVYRKRVAVSLTLVVAANDWRNQPKSEIKFSIRAGQLAVDVVRSDLWPHLSYKQIKKLRDYLDRVVEELDRQNDNIVQTVIAVGTDVDL